MGRAVVALSKSSTSKDETSCGAESAPTNVIGTEELSDLDHTAKTSEESQSSLASG